MIALYRDIFAEITAKAMPVCDPTSDDPERVRYYRIPVGPLHRAAGKLGFQMFGGEAYLTAFATALRRIRSLEEKNVPKYAQQIAREALGDLGSPEQQDRKTFTIPPGHEVVRDSEGRATGEVRPISPAVGKSE